MTPEEESLVRAILTTKAMEFIKFEESESYLDSLDTNEIIENTPTQLYCKGIFNRKR